jgi:hypothetical protein
MMQTKGFTWVLAFILIPLLLFTSCKKDDEFSDERIAEIAGNWVATSATFDGVDVVELGGNVFLEIKENGRFTFTIQIPEREDMVFTGRMGFDEEWLVVEYDEYPEDYEYYDITYDANHLHIGANSEFDFDGDGTDEWVVFFLDMVRA